ncbi:efflux RND transporter periplasmic adaptor subunit [Azospirillum thermophilum]|uniref:Efflux transporter periplasmic adaptor subunit n=1 Tax=Azospirillum thermophilum TaxID=2202148 RepID=A0A2S2CKZ8_9PROT|nr:efflux RND transporter periplasmic adaptor subunit [Azospirillum thermophilum]AWK85173.1 efflux transporter periplasmic adaptor subunit [Azospirillum thermophilum]
MKPCRRLSLAVLAALSLGTAGVAAQQPQGGPPPAVTTAPVESRDVAPSSEFIGRVAAIQSFDARARVEGAVEKVVFQEGQDVREGDLLYAIEQGPFQASLDSAKAQLASAEAKLREAERAFNRAGELRERGNVSQAQYDQALAERDAAQAGVLQAQAQVRTAELNLGYTRVTSPIDGRVGATAVTQGNLVNPATGVLATVVQLDPIRVVFSVSDRDLLATQRQFDVRSPADAVDKFIPTLRFSDGSDYGEVGKVEFVDNRIDPQTGTIGIRALFPNPQRLLLPGQFVTVRVRRDEPEQRPVVPVAAIQQDQQGRYVLVLDQDNRVQQRRIEVGPQIEQVIAVEKGLNPGETVLVDGVQKVRPGMTVQPVASSQTAERPDAPRKGAPRKGE